MTTLVDIAADPKTQVALLTLALSAFSTVHTFLGKHPRAKRALELAAHFVGPLNLPAMRAAVIALCRAVVDAEDKKYHPIAVAPSAPVQAAPAPGPGNVSVKDWSGT